MMTFDPFIIESLENISSIKKIIKQIVSHSSKVLHFPNPEDKKLEVSLMWCQNLAKNPPYLAIIILKTQNF